MQEPPWIFLSYRTEGSSDAAPRIRTELQNIFGAGTVFLAPATIAPGISWDTTIYKGLKECRVLIALIDRAWSARKLHDPQDWVRREIRYALEEGKIVVPLLIDGAKMPGADQLPADIRDLTRRQAVPLSTRWQRGLKRALVELAEWLREAVESKIILRRVEQSWWEFGLIRNDWTLLCDGREILRLRHRDTSGVARVFSGSRQLLVRWDESTEYRWSRTSVSSDWHSSRGETKPLLLALAPGTTTFELQPDPDHRSWWRQVPDRGGPPRSLLKVGFEPPSWQHSTHA